MMARSLLFVFIGAMSWMIGIPAFAQSQQVSPDKTLAETRSIMAQIFSSMTTVLPFSMSRSEFALDVNRPKIQSELKKLSESTQDLTIHTKKFGGSYSFIATAMAQDFKDVYRYYQKGAYSEARYLLQQVGENCASCHMQLPDPGHAPKADQFFKDVKIATLSPLERTRLQVALRQFDDALTTWEEVFKTYEKPNELVAMDALNEYLKVAIRVKSDPRRAEQTLTALLKRVNLPQFMLRDVKSWKQQLAALGPEVQKKGSELKRAAKIMKQARQRMEYPLDRSGLVDFIIASSLLNRSVNSEALTPKQKAEAYYLLGVTESLIGQSVWLTQTNYYFEAAIRAAPKTEYARRAFEALEQQVLLEYSGSSGIDIPDDVQRNLDVLKHML